MGSIKSKYLVKKSDIDSFSGTEKSHYLNANARRLNKSLGDLVGLTTFGFHLIEVPPGCESTEFHCHSHEDECTYVLSGTGVVRIGEEEFEINSGDFIGYPAGGMAHSMINCGSEVLKCLVVGTRAPHDVADYPKLGKRLYRNLGRTAELVDIDQVSHPTMGEK